MNRADRPQFGAVRQSERKELITYGSISGGKNSGYTVMSNHHLRNQELSLKAKGLLSQMLSLPDNWDYTLKGLSLINREKIDAIREAIRELERVGYIVRSRERDKKDACAAQTIIY